MPPQQRLFEQEETKHSSERHREQMLDVVRLGKCLGQHVEECGAQQHADGETDQARHPGGQNPEGKERRPDQAQRTTQKRRAQYPQQNRVDDRYLNAKQLHRRIKTTASMGDPLSRPPAWKSPWQVQQTTVQDG